MIGQNAAQGDPCALPLPHGPSLTLPPAGDILRAKLLIATNRIIATNLAILEELADEHDVAMAKLRDALPSPYRPYVELADHFTETRFDTLRNRILRTCNDARREMEDLIAGMRLGGDQ